MLVDVEGCVSIGKCNLAQQRVLSFDDVELVEEDRSIELSHSQSLLC